MSNEALRFAPPNPQDALDERGFLSKLLPGRPSFRAASPRELSGPNRQLWVLRDNKVSPVTVVVGASDGSRTRITGEQFKAGDTVIADMIVPTS